MPRDTALARLSQSATDPAFVQNPYPFYTRARDQGDFIFWEDYGLVCAATHRAVNAVLKDRRMGRTPPPDRCPVVTPQTQAFYDIEAHSMLELEPPRHKRLRGLVLRAFTSRRIAGLAPEIEALAASLAAALPHGEPFDLLEAFARPLPVTIIARLLGVPESMGDQLLAWSNAMVAMYQARRTPEIEAAAGQAAEEFAGFLRGYVDERRTRPADDLITHLIAAEEEGERLSNNELISTCILLLNAGHEATVHTIGNGVKTLLEVGNADRLLTPDRVAATVEEILRFDPPLHMFTRWLYEDVELFGQPLPKGTEVAALLGSAGRDSAVFAEPDRFDPAANSAAHVAFGAGIHFCVGAPLARLELQIALPALFAARPTLGIEKTPAYADVYHFHGLSDLVLRA